jgi:hypothetical protein
LRGNVTAMVAASFSEDLLIGLILGFFLGLLVGPLIRSWLNWREWVSASREADLLRDVLDRMEADPWPDLEPPGVPHGSVSSGRQDAW